jgi:hypothetical protein
MRIFVEVFGSDEAGHTIEGVVVDEDRPEDGALGLRVLRERFIECEIERG